MRTKQDFDKWFSDNNGDPWNYKSYEVVERLSTTMFFLKKKIEKKQYTFIEFGAYNGDFTRHLLNNFEDSSIYVNDISEVAIDQAKKNIGNDPRVKYIVSDMLEFDAGAVVENGTEKIILLIECLYYITEPERALFIERNKKNFPNCKLFISCVITGGKYFTEPDLLSLLKKNDYKLKGIKTLNFRRSFNFEILRRMISFASNYISPLRRHYAKQVIYYFEPL